MAFQAKRLRVQLPCGEASVYEELEPVLPVAPTTWCPLPSRVPTDVTQLVLCGPGTERPPVDPDSVTVSPEGLKTLRRQLEARLALVADAERAVAAARDGQGGV
jgi:hypothetical protein